MMASRERGGGTAGDGGRHNSAYFGVGESYAYSCAYNNCLRACAGRGGGTGRTHGAGGLHKAAAAGFDGRSCRAGAKHARGVSFLHVPSLHVHTMITCTD